MMMMMMKLKYIFNKL